jgi:hypothetical protein
LQYFGYKHLLKKIKKKKNIWFLLNFIGVGYEFFFGKKKKKKMGPNGRSILDDITEDAPGWFDKAKTYATEKVEKVVQQAKPDGGYQPGQ